MKVVFFGTHQFASVILQSMIDNPKINVSLVITQPDKPVGRKQDLKKSFVKILSENNNIKVEQPENLKNYNLVDKFDLGITAQYGLLIPEHILNTPTHGTLNVHTSLLPKYRGASPIQSVLINGETETGVTIMKMDKGLDTGPILLQKRLKIKPHDTYTTLSENLAKISSQALSEAIDGYVEGKLKPQIQNNSLATECHELSREDGQIDWNKTSKEIYNLYRGLTPWPGIWTMWQEKRLKLLEIKESDKIIDAGKVIIEEKHIYIGCSEKSIELLKLQLEGKKPMNVIEFLNGYKSIANEIL
ncbi:MAG: methionyl-tRNA formyltransferase [Candidatus Magasanikbacteria bacterium RIFCSPHIGHO2_01_FULL_33_34]|uniref:Methionyl-tRNA formyltransferase n=1 Tax=Candidatus Magasanikbacteria bacterium RIFCSPHIGHO2_01_FULL_33_34 TaxID=1798671 RepID=A0A1F6LLF2_9BACT|nr:MAG: methionyl-tRNA formyltransferase [Candidatus Magasanikbacteria bacterium RIFCSPHIGHO2_01_FULL_33_34]OGH65867.1 MAG: methionyl-tRNA formyltransferase [Candidatus Magasanikbacteria bacterium RIFCSPHIGHO2_02_FULL_33_17]OGH75413.1 MAG: methionyl-tRNA formyltransferase [Candidatus Magasanikbacteria bacterium RIFCSPLOWO2_01_FULL_33_34]